MTDAQPGPVRRSRVGVLRVASLTLAALLALFFYPKWQAHRLESRTEAEFYAEQAHMERDLADAARTAPDAEARAAVLERIVPSYYALYTKYRKGPAPGFAKRAAIVAEAMEDLFELRQRFDRALQFEEFWPSFQPSELQHRVFEPQIVATVREHADFLADVEQEIERRRGAARRSITTSGLPEEHRIALWQDIDAAYTSVRLRAERYREVTAGVVRLGKVYEFLIAHRNDLVMRRYGPDFSDPALAAQYDELASALASAERSHGYRHGR